jgi:hypothetical protein
MTRDGFNHLLDSINALSPEQVRQLRRALDGKRASSEANQPPGREPPGAIREAAAGPDQTIGEALDGRQAAAEEAPAGGVMPAEVRKPIWEVFQEITASIPDEIWEKMPADSSEQLDHYLYGTPRRPTSR